MGKPPDATRVLAENVAREMKERGWTQLALARKSGVSQSRIHYLLGYSDKQDRHPSTDTVARIAAAFGQEAWELMRPPGDAPARSAVDRAVLARIIQFSADALRSEGILPSDADLAHVVAGLYDKYATGAGWERAGADMVAELKQMGMNIAVTSGSTTSGGTRDGRRSTRTSTRNRG